MIPYQPTGEDMDFIRSQDCIHTDLSWQVTGLLSDMRRNGTKIYFDFSKRYQHPDVPEILKNINYGIFSFEEENEEVRELLKMGCGLGAEILLATFAGDSYGSGFLAGIFRGEEIPSAMRRGAAKSAEIVGIFEPYHI